MVMALRATSTGTRWVGPRMSPERVRLVTVADSVRMVSGKAILHSYGLDPGGGIIDRQDRAP
jgi:hypothetical protein